MENIVTMEFHYCINRKDFEKIIAQTDKGVNLDSIGCRYDLANHIRINIAIDDRIPSIPKINNEILAHFDREVKWSKDNRYLMLSIPIE